MFIVCWDLYSQWAYRFVFRFSGCRCWWWCLCLSLPTDRAGTADLLHQVGPGRGVGNPLLPQLMREESCLQERVVRGEGSDLTVVPQRAIPPHHALRSVGVVHSLRPLSHLDRLLANLLVSLLQLVLPIRRLNDNGGLRGASNTAVLRSDSAANLLANAKLHVRRKQLESLELSTAWAEILRTFEFRCLFLQLFTVFSSVLLPCRRSYGTHTRSHSLITRALSLQNVLGLR